MNLTIEGEAENGPAILIVAKKTDGETAKARARLGEVTGTPSSIGEKLASRVVFDYWTRGTPGPKDYSWLLPLTEHARFSECLSGGVLIAEETGNECCRVGYANATTQNGEAGHVAREIYNFLEQGNE